MAQLELKSPYHRTSAWSELFIIRSATPGREGIHLTAMYLGQEVPAEGGTLGTVMLHFLSEHLPPGVRRAIAAQVRAVFVEREVPFQALDAPADLSNIRFAIFTRTGPGTTGRSLLQLSRLTRDALETAVGRIGDAELFGPTTDTSRF